MSPERDVPDRQVLEHNLALLLTRAYTPVCARAAFRAELARTCLRAAEALARRRSPWSSPWVRVALAASVLIALLVAVRWSGGAREPATLEAIVARGEVAVRRARDGAWSSAPAGLDVGPLAFDGQFLEVATPPTAPTRVALAAGAGEPWAVFPAAHVELERSADGVRAALRSGGVVARGERTAIATSQGTVELVRGSVRVACEAPDDPAQWEPRANAADSATGWVHVSVREGLARVPRRGALLALGPGGEAFLWDGESLLALEDVGASEPERTPVAAPEAPAAAPGRRALVVGEVRAQGAPLERFRVVALREISLPQVAEPLAWDVSDAAGRFELFELAPERYRFFVRAEGWALARSELTTLSPLASDALQLAFELERGATLRGAVVDDASGAPLADACVVSESDTTASVLSLDPSEQGDDVQRARVGADGAFEFTHLSRGTQILRADAPGYGPTWLEVPALASGETRSGLVFRLRPSGGVEGVVLGAGDVPVERALVLASTLDFESKRPCLTFRRALTDAEGRYAIDGLSVGAWGVLNFGAEARIDVASYTPEFRFAAVRAGERSTVDFRGAPLKQVLRGVVRDAQGQPLAGRTLMVARVERALPPPAGGWSSATTAADGSYRIPDLDSGLHELFISGRTPAEMSRIGAVQVGSGPETVLDLALAGGSITGLVRDAERNEGVELGVLIALRRNGPDDFEFVAKVFTDASGRYELEFLAPGEYRVFAYAARDTLGQECADALALAAGERRECVDFELRPGARLALAVVRADGQPATAARVGLVDARGVETPFTQDGRVDALGRMRIDGIKPGRWRVTARDAAGAASAEVEFVAGERAELELRLGGN